MQQQGRLVIFILLAFISQKKTTAQNFDYAFSKETYSFEFLNDSTKAIIDSSVWDDKSYRIPVGFNFNFAGNSFDSITVKTNGTITFDSVGQFNFSALFMDFIADVDSNNRSISPLAYHIVTPVAGGALLKVEFRNVMLVAPNGDRSHMSFQIWLYQQGSVIEFHMGDADTPTQPCLVGLINTNNTEEFPVGYLLSGSAVSPTGVLINSGGNVVQLSGFPLPGEVYRFISN